MINYQPNKLDELCFKIIANQKVSLNEKDHYDKIQNLRKTALSKGLEEFEKNYLKYIDILFNPYELFYFKQQNTFGYYKEYLDIEIVKKYIPEMGNIFIERKTIPELDEATKIFTKGKVNSFNIYFLLAHRNRKEKLINKLAIEWLRNEYNI